MGEKLELTLTWYGSALELDKKGEATVESNGGNRTPTDLPVVLL